MLKNSINDDNVDNDNILASFIDEINETDSSDSSTKFDLSESNNITNIIDNVATSTNITVQDNVKTNISTYASTVNNDINNIDPAQSITKILTQTTKVAVASTELLTDTNDKPNFAEDSSTFTNNISTIQTKIAANAFKSNSSKCRY